MKEYLLLFWNTSGDEGYNISPEQMEEGMNAWQMWIGNIAMQGKLIMTKPIHWAGTMVGNQGIVHKPAIKSGEMVTGYLLCKAESQNEVENWSKSCPILHQPNGFTEIREVMPIEI